MESNKTRSESQRDDQLTTNRFRFVKSRRKTSQQISYIFQPKINFVNSHWNYRIEKIVEFSLYFFSAKMKAICKELAIQTNNISLSFAIFVHFDGKIEMRESNPACRSKKTKKKQINRSTCTHSTFKKRIFVSDTEQEMMKIDRKNVCCDATNQNTNRIIEFNLSRCKCRRVFFQSILVGCQNDKKDSIIILKITIVSLAHARAII